MRITKTVVANADKTHEHLFAFVEENPGTSIHGTLPCTAWSQWQTTNEHKLGKKYRETLNERRKKSRTLLRKFLQIADLVLLLGV